MPSLLRLSSRLAVVQHVGDRLDGEQHDWPEGRLGEERPQQTDQQVGLDNEELEEEQQVQLDEWQKQRSAASERQQERLGERPWLQPLTGIGGVAEELPTATARPPGGGDQLRKSKARLGFEQCRQGMEHSLDHRERVERALAG